MMEFLVSLPDHYIFFALSSIFLIISVLALLAFKRFVLKHMDFADNTVVSSVSSVIGIIYGVLVGLMALYLINNISYTSDAVQREANSVANLYRDSKWLNEPARSKIKIEIKNYLQQVIDVEFPLMKAGQSMDHVGDILIEELTEHLIAYRAVTGADSLLLHDMLDEIKTLYNARQQRIHMSSSELHPATWIVILIGTILTIGINFFYRVHLGIHLLTTGIAALMASSMIFLLITIDRPFRGQFVVEPTAFQSLLTYMETSPDRSQKKITRESKKTSALFS